MKRYIAEVLERWEGWCEIGRYETKKEAVAAVQADFDNGQRNIYGNRHTKDDYRIITEMTFTIKDRK